MRDEATAIRSRWLDELTEWIPEVLAKWHLSLHHVFDNASCAWVASVVRSDGTRAVLKFGMPHMEGAHEIDGLRFWNGDAIVLLLEDDVKRNAMLLESCEPGLPLSTLPEPEQDEVLAKLLARLWRTPLESHPFRPLSAMTDYWTEETMASRSQWLDHGLTMAGLELFSELSRPSSSDVVLTTDLHAGNILRAQREPWLVIDPKPFVGDRAYDATQHLMNCKERLLRDPEATIACVAGLLDIDEERVRLWMFARSAAEPRDEWTHASLRIARALS